MLAELDTLAIVIIQVAQLAQMAGHPSTIFGAVHTNGAEAKLVFSVCALLWDDAILEATVADEVAVSEGDLSPGCGSYGK